MTIKQMTVYQVFLATFCSFYFTSSQASVRRSPSIPQVDYSDSSTLEKGEDNSLITCPQDSFSLGNHGSTINIYNKDRTFRSQQCQKKLMDTYVYIVDKIMKEVSVTNACSHLIPIRLAMFDGPLENLHYSVSLCCKIRRPNYEYILLAVKNQCVPTSAPLDGGLPKQCPLLPSDRCSPGSLAHSLYQENRTLIDQEIKPVELGMLDLSICNNL